MGSFRNNSIKFKESRLTDQDVLDILDHSADRQRAACSDLAHIVGIAMNRGLVDIELVEQLTQHPQPEEPEAIA